MSNLIESFYLSNNLPLDKKTKITSISNIDTELPVFHRYLGLIFYVDDTNKFYTFKNDINNPELLFTDNNAANIFGIYVDNYQNILTELNKYNILGKIIYVFPLNVAFIFNGNTWEYFNGIYNIRTNIDLNNLASILKFNGKKVIKSNILYIWESNELTPFISVTNDTASLLKFENTQTTEAKLYKHREQIFQVFDNKVYKLYSYQKQTNNFNVTLGNTKITEFNVSDIGDNLLPPYINAILWITNNINIGENKDVLIPIKLDIYYFKENGKWIVNCASDKNYLGVLELSY